MLGRTHRAYSDVFWLGTTATANVLAIEAGKPIPFNLVVVGLGAVLAKPFSSGRFLSPDMDQRWAPGRPRRNYDWRYHRGFTHRVWFATMLTILFGILPMVVSARIGVPRYIYLAELAPLAGWWSHISGDMIYGRIKIMGKPVGLGWHTGGLSETGKLPGKARWLPVNPAEQVFMMIAICLAIFHVGMFIHGA